MRTKGILMLALTAVAALSCSVREDDMSVMGGTVRFKATLADAPFTKTVLQSDGSVYWSPGDAVNLFYGATGSTRLESDNTEAAAQVNFTGTLEGFVPDGSSYFWAVYPYDEANSFDGSAVTLTLPAVQTAVAGTFADDLFVTMAHSKDYTLQFYNVCGGVKFSVAGEGIKYVTFKGNADEVLAGKVKVGLDEEGKPQVKEVVDGKKEIRVDAPGGGTFETGKWYYVVAFPDTLASGYTMSFYDDKLIAERVENETVTIRRSVWGKLTEADDVAITATKWLTFTSEGTTTISLLNQGDNAPVLYYSTDHTNWTQWDYSELTFTSSAPLYLCGDNPGGFCTSVTQYSKFVGSGSKFSVSGDIMSLLSYDKDIKEIPCDYCFGHMFDRCKLLTKAPDLPATTLAPGCYFEMFHGCESLETAPVLPATRLYNWSYAYMFQGCSNLNYVKCLAEDIDTICTYYWLDAVKSSGTFVKASGMTGWPSGESGIPSGWTVENVVTASKYLTFTSEGTTTISLSSLSSNTPKLFYSYDKTNWTKWDYSALEFTSSSPLYLCGDNPGGFSSSLSKMSYFKCDGSNFNVSGDVMSLLAYDKDLLKIPNEYCFAYLFQGCTGLTSAPDLNATTLADNCYYKMFYGCTGLTSAPDLNATKLADDCYYQMFYGCTSLTSAPDLNATTLADYCYYQMFSGCTKLSYVKCLATDISATSCLGQWLKGVAASGTFVKASGMTGWSSGESGIPAGWTIKNAE